MNILSVDSSSQAATAAVLCDGEILCEYTQNQNKTQSVKMLPMIERMLSDVGLELSDIDVFASGVGPGSFTGVRIGVATVRGFAKTLGKPAVAVNSLEILENGVSAFGGTVISLISARENECYCAAYEQNKELLAPCVMTVEEIADFARGKQVLFVGDGAVLNRDALERLAENAAFAEGRLHLISGASCAEVAYRKVMAGETGNCESLIPLYLRKSQAEREYEEKMKQNR